MSVPDQHVTADESSDPPMSWTEATVRAQAIHEGIAVEEPGPIENSIPVPEPVRGNSPIDMTDLLAGLPPLPEPPAAFGDLDTPLPPAPPLFAESPAPSPVGEVTVEPSSVPESTPEQAELPDPPQGKEIEALLRLHTIQSESDTDAELDDQDDVVQIVDQIAQPAPPPQEAVVPELPPIPPPPPPPPVTSLIEQVSNLPTPPPPPSSDSDDTNVAALAAMPQLPEPAGTSSDPVAQTEPGTVWDSPVPTAIASDNPIAETKWETETVQPVEPAADTPVPTAAEPQQVWPLASKSTQMSPTASWPTVQPATDPADTAAVASDSPSAEEEVVAAATPKPVVATVEPEAVAPAPFANAFAQATPAVPMTTNGDMLDSWPEVAPAEPAISSIEDSFFVDSPEPTLPPKRTAFLKRLLAKKDDPQEAEDLCPSCDSPARVDINNPNLGQRHLSCPSCSKMWIESTLDGVTS